MSAGAGRQVAPVLVLDVGRVCIRLHPERCAEQLGVANLEEILVAHPEIGRLIERLEEGRLSSDHFIATASRTLNLPPDTIRLAWMANLGDELPGIAAIVETAVAAGLRVVLLSDTSAMHADAFWHSLSFRHQLSGRIYSHEVGQRKPHPAMYEAVETQFCNGGVPLLFADDRPSNTAGAAARGWSVHTMPTPDMDQLHAILSARLAACRT